jgi:hypothetical protein
MAEQSDITSEWYVGEDKVFPFTIYQKSAAGVLSTTPQAITGWALRWDVRLNDNAADPPIITKTTGAGIAITDGPSGQGTITIDDTDTDSLAPRVYRHSLKRTDAGSETELLYGNAVLGKRTTR